MKYAIITFIVITMFVGGFLYNENILHTVELTESDNEELLLVYKKHSGPYKDVGKIMEIIASGLAQSSISDCIRFGIYFDNPQEVIEQELRSVTGCIIPPQDSVTMVNIAEVFDIAEYHSTKSVMTEFPYKGNFSILMGILKVYPALKEYIQDKEYSTGPVMELYDTKKGVIRYITPKNADREFYDALLGIY